METSTIVDIILKLGIGALSIIGMIYVINGAQRERLANQKALMDYINTNNHETTDLVRESTQAILASTEASKAHSASINTNTEILKSLLTSLLSK